MLALLDKLPEAVRSRMAAMESAQDLPTKMKIHGELSKLGCGFIHLGTMICNWANARLVGLDGYR